ncbi:DUF1028 domain-containing protein [Roseomonas sp. BN140053]|uniref:DUF1028 domain-containing protein n=1 Tax=Roseomonas sp. BN140053 TaxID=3391898 RepID=UPI0039EBC93B
MTWSILARDPATGAFAVAVTTCAFAVGASCPFLRAGVGAVSTQSFTNRYLGPAILDGMARGLPPGAAIEGALAGDAGRHIRQVHALDRHGRGAAWTGSQCVDWAGDLSGAAVPPDVSLAGNMLAGGEVLAGTLAAFTAGTALPLPERLLAALDAGEAAGGDRRGRQSAALVMVGAEDFPDLDLRVDDHPEPLAELRRLLGIWRRDRAPFLDRAPRKAAPSGFIDLDAIEARWRELGLDLRFPR